MTEEQEKQAGQILADYLGLKRSREHKDRYVLPDGTKTALGVWRTLSRHVADLSQGDFSSFKS
jgi:hypothetical protein